MTDERTLAAYAGRVEQYASMMDIETPSGSLRRFIADLPEGARVLDLGCGPATCSVHMRAAGLIPDPVDASPEMVALANKSYDIGARVATFDDIDGEAIYDGVWANFSLLHADRADLPRHLAAIAQALRPGGAFHIGMKTGTGVARDAIDRRYTYVSVPELEGLLSEAGLRVDYVTEGREVGLAGSEDPFVLMQAVRD